MREGWTYKKLGEVGVVVTGSTPSTKDEANYASPDYCFVKPSDLPSKGIAVIDESEFHISSKAFSSARQLPKGSVVVSCIGIIGKVGILNKDACTNQQINAIIPNDTILPKCLAYIICNNKRELEQIANAPIVPIINKSEFSKFSIPVPPLSEQQSIVAELDKINELISLKKAQLSDLDSLAQSIFYDMFGDPVENDMGWEVKRLSEISSLICNGNTPKGGSEVYVDNGYLFFRSQNVWKNRIDMDDVAYIDETTHFKLKKSTLMHNDLLITKTGRFNTENSSLGRTALFEGEDGSANINGHVYLVRLKTGMVHKFVLYILISESYRELIRRTCVGGIDKRQLNKDHIEDFPIIFPPIELQSDFVKKVALIEQQKAQISSTIKDLETLLASRMQYWFD